MTVYIVFKVARQELGEYVFATVEKAFQKKEDAEAYFVARAQNWKEAVQGHNCYCERGLTEVEVE